MLLWVGNTATAMRLLAPVRIELLMCDSAFLQTGLHHVKSGLTVWYFIELKPTTNLLFWV